MPRPDPCSATHAIPDRPDVLCRYPTVSDAVATARDFRPDDFRRVADIVHRAVTITQKLDKEARESMETKGRKNPASLNAFREFLGEGENVTDIIQLRKEVEDWVGTFSLPWQKNGS